MMKKLIIFMVTYVVCGSAFSAWAAADGRACSEADISGVYSLADMTETPPGAELKWYKDYHYQYLIFNSDKSYDFVASKHRLIKPEELQKSVAVSKSDGNVPIVRKYTLDATGVLTLFSNDKADYIYRCIIVERPQNKQVAGDLYLSAYSKTNSLMEKLFHRGQ